VIIPVYGRAWPGHRRVSDRMLRLLADARPKAGTNDTKTLLLV
jgi:hypothetical protein